MEKRYGFEGKKVLVLGLAKSGLAAAELLHSLGAEVVVNDSSPDAGSEEVQSSTVKRYTGHLRRTSG